MQEFSNLGISFNEYNDMLDVNSEISELSEIEIAEKVAILEYFGCNNKEIANILISNLLYFSRTNEDVISFLAYLKCIGF